MVRDVRELGALLGEASSVVMEGFPRTMLALAEVLRIAEVDVVSLEVSFKDPD